MGLFLSNSSFAQAEIGDLLKELNLRSSQRAEISAVLVGGMQSLTAINSELDKLNNSTDTSGNNPEFKRMYTALLEQRLRLAQSMVADILGVLDREQLQKFDFSQLLESLPENLAAPATWEQEI